MTQPSSSHLPDHVAIILDGNGRWAKKRGLSRSEGHRAGGEALDRLLDTALEIKIPIISMYAFSTENWKRPAREVSALWKLMLEFFRDRLEKSLQKGIRVVASGDLSRLPAKNRRIIESVIEKTKKGRNLTANFCVNYGSQDEILRAVNRIIQEAAAGNRSKTKPVTRKEFEKHLYTAQLGPVDLLVRPGGEKRISNFLLWQCAYAEMYFTDVLWPDFDETCLREALDWYRKRERRFGALE